ncbi:MAG: glycosyltransferase family A protein [bacterium]|nr:glycosyltransferase family A protein [bacterium]
MISIIIPVYNSASTLEDCLDHIFKQEYIDYEVIVVDDGSTDRSAGIASEFKLKLIPMCRNKGAGAARNRGAREAKGDILCFTDSDCIVPPDWLLKIAGQFDDKNTGAVGGGYAFSAGNSVLEIFAHLELVYRRSGFPKFVSAAVSNNLACRKEIFEKLGGFPEYFTGAGMEEIVFTFALSRKYKLIWDSSNGVGHYFCDKIKNYLKQQYIFAYRAALVTVFIPAISSVEIFRHKNNILQPLSFYLSHFFLLLSVFSIKYGILFILFLFLMFLSNLNFLLFIRKKISLFSFWKVLVYIYIRNFAWSAGFITGIAAGILRRKRDLSRIWLETYK